MRCYYRQFNVCHYKLWQFPKILLPFFSLVDLKVSSADQTAGLMFEMNAAKEDKTPLKAATPGDQKVTTLEMHESHQP